MSMNKVFFLGNIVNDPVINYTEAETPLAIASATIALNRIGAKEGQQSADFAQLKAFGKTAETFEKYVKKGTKIAVEAHFQSGSYTNKEGNKVYTNEFVVDRLELLGSKPKAETSEPADAPVAEEDEIPFEA